VLLVVHVGLFDQQMKNFCEKHQHRHWRVVFVDVWSLTYFHTFCWTDKRKNICVNSWGGPRDGNPPLAAACVSISTEVCCCWWSFSSSSSSKETSQSLASEPHSESLSATRISVMTYSSSFIFFQAIATNTYNRLPSLHSSAWEERNAT